MKTFKTTKGTELPLANLKGKDYMLVAHRLQWFVEEVPSYHINETFLVLNAEETVAQVTINVLNEQGQAVKKVMATKRETKADFGDFTEKASTGALGRALAQLGYGTQFAQQDLDEGDRIVDAPLQSAGSLATATPSAPTGAKVSSFRKKKEEKPVEAAKSAPASLEDNSSKNGWLP